MTKNLLTVIAKLRLSKINRNYGLSLLILLSVFVFACQPAADNKDKPAFSTRGVDITPTPSQELNEFESELKAMKTVGFYHIYTLKRKDEATFESDDKKFVKENIHYATNRTSLIKDDTILFIGTNYKPTDEQLEALKERFEFGDYSKPEEQIAREKAEKKAEREKLKEEMEEANPNSTNQNTEE